MSTDGEATHETGGEIGALFDAAAGDFLRLAPLLWDPVSAGLVAVSAPRPGERVLDACWAVGSSALRLAACGTSAWWNTSSRCH